MKNFLYQKDKVEEVQGGVMAIKYLITNNGKDCHFLQCGVILKGTVSMVCHETQKRIILALLSRHVSQAYYKSICQGQEWDHSAGASVASASSGPANSAFTTVEELQTLNGLGDDWNSQSGKGSDAGKGSGK